MYGEVASEAGGVSVVDVAEEVADLEETHLREATKRTEELTTQVIERELFAR